MTQRLLQQRPDLQLIICARNTQSIKLYRITSDTEFVAPIAPLIFGEPLKYPPFLSTTGNPRYLHSFIPASGKPLVLGINCPANTCTAPMEGNRDGMEDEYLLGGRTTFVIDGSERVTDANRLSARADNMAGAI